FADALLRITAGECENDGLNRLVLAAGLSAREITLLRTFTKYLQQINFRFTKQYVEEALSNWPEITRNLVKLFVIRHSKKPGPETDQAVACTEKNIAVALDQVGSLDEDRILRQFWQLIRASLRTNYFQK